MREHDVTALTAAELETARRELRRTRRAGGSPARLTRLPERPVPGRRARGLRKDAPAPQVLPDTLSRLGIAGGAVYDVLVALAAKEHGAALATRDTRARGTYDAAGAEVIVVT